MPASAPPDPPRCTPCAHGSGHTRETAALADSRALAHVVSGRSSRGEAVAPFDLGAVGISRRRRAILLRVRRRRVQQHDDHREGGPIHVPPHQKKRTVPRHARVRRSGRRALRNCPERQTGPEARFSTRDQSCQHTTTSVTPRHRPTPADAQPDHLPSPSLGKERRPWTIFFVARPVAGPGSCRAGAGRLAGAGGSEHA